jgi:hypothetical protein
MPQARQHAFHPEAAAFAIDRKSVLQREPHLALQGFAQQTTARKSVVRTVVDTARKAPGYSTPADRMYGRPANLL